MKCAVLGSPVAHSLSPVMHRAAYDAAGLRGWTYDAVEVGEDDLSPFLDGLDDAWRGLSLTMPLKRRAVALVDDLDDRARAAEAVNTVVLDGGRRRGSNTDVPGARAALVEHGVAGPAEVVCLGGGATATSTLLAARELGCTRARLLVRDPARAGGTVRTVGRTGLEVEVAPLGPADVGTPDLVVSTVPAAAQPADLVEACLAAGVVFEVVYDPWPTPLAAAAAAAGTTLVDGLDLLAHQAALQLSLMADLVADPALLRAAALAELRRRADGVDSARRGAPTS